MRFEHGMQNDQDKGFIGGERTRQGPEAKGHHDMQQYTRPCLLSGQVHCKVMRLPRETHHNIF